MVVNWFAIWLIHPHHPSPQHTRFPTYMVTYLTRWAGKTFDEAQAEQVQLMFRFNFAKTDRDSVEVVCPIRQYCKLTHQFSRRSVDSMYLHWWQGILPLEPEGVFFLAGGGGGSSSTARSAEFFLPPPKNWHFALWNWFLCLGRFPRNSCPAPLRCFPAGLVLQGPHGRWVRTGQHSSLEAAVRFNDAWPCHHLRSHG